MLIPLHTDRRLQSVPWMNIAIILCNIIVFILTRKLVMFSHSQLPGFGASGFNITDYYLNPADLRLHQFITSAFLHHDPYHLLGNMVFLYAFGNSVEDRLGKLAYLGFYLSGAVASGLGHALLETSPALGASGAVCAVSGAYLVLFPKTYVTIFYLLIFIGTFEVSSLYLIALQITQDLVFYLLGSGGVAYVAHLAGYALGIVVASLLLGSRLLPREPYDLLALIEHGRKRAQFAALTREGYRPWMAQGAQLPHSSQSDSPELRRIQDLRAKIAEHMREHRLSEAADMYAQLLDVDASQVLGLQQQRDLANQFMVENRYDLAARAYELLLNTYRSDAGREEVELILGLIYTRYLHRRQRARELLQNALTRIQDDQHRQLARQLLAEIEA